MDTIVSSVQAAVHDALVWPGVFLATKLIELAPGLASALGVELDAPTPIAVSLLAYCLTSLGVFGFVKLLRNVVRHVGALVRTFWFRACESTGGIRTRVILQLRRLFTRRAVSAIEFTPTVDFDDLDMAVLRSASARGPGFAISAPDLAEAFTLRPTQVQRSLDKLCKNKMLECVIGSTEGYDNYRLSGLGAAFTASCERQRQ